MGIEPQTVTPKASASRAWYGSSIDEFLQKESDSILGALATNCGFTLLATQKNAWLFQIEFLQAQLKGLSGQVFLEFDIPRMGRRIDAVALIGPVVFVIEFKVGESSIDGAARDQVWDYALDLKNFHEASHNLPLVPILVLTEAKELEALSLIADDDRIYRPISVNAARFRGALDHALLKIDSNAFVQENWSTASYKPTPTIVEAAKSLYAHHSVDAIKCFDAGKKNLRITCRRVEELVDEARATGRKVICFVTGVPGAGKTLVGLNIATRRREANSPAHAVFLSGNGPLVAVLREALTRDEVDRKKSQGEKVRKGKVGESVKAFIQNVHHFRDDALADPNPPAERIVIFDEAQRAWNLRQTSNFMRRKKNRPGFNQTEPEFLISCLERHTGWAVIICLVGGGQEINTGEAGIGAWLEAVTTKFSEWHMYISSRLTDSEYAATESIKSLQGRTGIHLDDSLHLAVSLRSFRAEDVSAFVKALLDGEKELAKRTFKNLTSRYPIVLSRDLDRAKGWVRQRARGSERFGLLASSKAQRLKPHAIDIRVDVDPVPWFLNPREDTRSSYYLEDAATEFQVQGLELDWTCVAWCADLRFSDPSWSYHDFRGDRWCNIANSDNRYYLLNAYRVLLTRARQGMAIFVPAGDPKDPTRLPNMYDRTFNYLADLGIPVLL